MPPTFAAAIMTYLGDSCLNSRLTAFGSNKLHSCRVLVIIFEEINFSKIILEYIEILYAGILSGGAAFALQIFGQKNISAAPAAIIMSLEGVIAAIAAWIILHQILGWNNIIGCSLILFGVLLSQLAPIYEKTYK